MKSLRDLRLLLWRSSVQIYRDWFTVGVKAATLGFFAAILGLVFQNLGFRQRNIQDRLGILFFVTSNQSFGPLVGALNTFPAEVEKVRHDLCFT